MTTAKRALASSETLVCGNCGSSLAHTEYFCFGGVLPDYVLLQFDEPPVWCAPECMFTFVATVLGNNPEDVELFRRYLQQELGRPVELLPSHFHLQPFGGSIPPEEYHQLTESGAPLPYLPDELTEPPEESRSKRRCLPFTTDP
jgi:hypothetical protein